HMSYVNLLMISDGSRRGFILTLYILSQVVPAGRGFPCLMVFFACFVVFAFAVAGFARSGDQAGLKASYWFFGVFPVVWRCCRAMGAAVPAPP
ncbi:MAG: hypothetical protein Q8O90_09490, partial [Elusimicrobiota bacterium]|nr:hypothetical protein [Elusimicrobiota bacterium]